MDRLPTNEPNLGFSAPLLVVEKDPGLGDSIAGAMVTAGYGPVLRSDHVRASEAVERFAPEAIILQLLPVDDSCLDVLDAIPDRRRRPAIVVISPDDAMDLRVRALELGADDYLPDSFRVEEMVMRLETVRRRREFRRGRYLRLGRMLVDKETARFGDGRIWTMLTPKEWQVFAALIDRREQLVSRQHLKQVARGKTEMSDNALEAMICRLRAKAGALGVRIRASRGVGYTLEPDSATVWAAPAPSYSSSSPPTPSRRGTVCGSQVMGR
jgi:DNA-binding response OmpR family regulator